MLVERDLSETKNSRQRQGICHAHGAFSLGSIAPDTRHKQAFYERDLEWLLSVVRPGACVPTGTSKWKLPGMGIRLWMQAAPRLKNNQGYRMMKDLPKILGESCNLRSCIALQVAGERLVSFSFGMLIFWETPSILRLAFKGRRPPSWMRPEASFLVGDTFPFQYTC